MALGQILQEYNREKKERAREDEEKKKIILLRRKKENLEHREKAFLKTINTGDTDFLMSRLRHIKLRSRGVYLKKMILYDLVEKSSF